MTTMSTSHVGSGTRLLQVDGLRGIAALSVVWFHMTTRFSDIYLPVQAPFISFPLGHYGVNLFFMVSGFVILMTLQRTRVGMDFVVSRFSRLYPSYWAAIILTFAVTHGLGLPGREVSATTALLNVFMFHGLFGVTHVDGVYWTLQVELLFYGWMFLLFYFRRLEQVHLWMIGLLALRCVWFIADSSFGVSLSWTVSMLLILKYIPWFALGVAAYSEIEAPARGYRRPAVRTSAALAIASLLIEDSVFEAALAIGLLLLLYAAASGRLKLLASPPLAWLGAVSYPLYLIHEYIGWSFMLTLMSHGVDINMSIALTLAAVLLLSQVVSRWIERPAMTAIRGAWRTRTSVRSRLSEQ